MSNYYRQRGDSGIILDEQGNRVSTKDPEVLGNITSLPVYDPTTRQARDTDPITSYRSELAGISSSIPTTESIEGSRKSSMESIDRLFNARIAEIEGRVRERVKAEEEAGVIAGGQARGINIRAGLAGSQFASARIKGVEARTKEAIRAAEDLGSQQKEAIYSKQEIATQNIQERFDKQIYQSNMTRLGILEKDIASTEQEQTQALEDFNVMSSGDNMDWWDNMKQDEQALQAMVDQTGKSKGYLDVMAQETFAKANALTWENVVQKNGDILRLGKDSSGDIIKQDLLKASELGIEIPIDPLIVKAGDNVLVFDKNDMNNEDGTPKFQEIKGQVSGGGIEQTEQIDAMAKNIIDGLGSLRNVPTEVRDLVNLRLREIREEGYQPDFLAKRMSAQQIKDISAFDTTIASWLNVKDLVTNLEDQFGPAVISAYDGSMTAFIRQYSKEPAFATAFAEIEKAFQLFRKETTGAQASDKEIKILRPLLPQLKERPDIFFSKLDETIKGTERAKRIYLESLEKGEVDISGFQEEKEVDDGLTDDEAYQEYLKTQQ